ncbi:hypothetical protein [Micromonospora thermarum]|uniref:Uncharacterized protein n=1 Tax=Micromonospora thermarum TaxID=2720024 RepID=A0ABX0ZFQ6_9ACTN|nr:hypothetical protein [Micromonospora thermarum]NJP35853.1 hypothetical protein [Micromonospora thermarum]
MVYEQRSPDGAFLRDPNDLTDSNLATADAVRDHLLGLFIPAALKAMPGQPYDPPQVHRWLAVMGDYLNRNAATGRSLGGRMLSSTDIVLHELWPLAGFRRPRVVVLIIFVTMWLIATATLHSQVGIGSTMVQLLGIGFPTLFILLVVRESWSVVWPEPQRLNPALLRNSGARRQLGLALVFALILCCAIAAAFVLAAVALGSMIESAMQSLFDSLFGSVPGGDSESELASEFNSYWLKFGLPFGLAAGSIMGLVAAFEIMEDRGTGASNPRSIPGGDLAYGLARGLVGGLGIIGVMIFSGQEAWLPYWFALLLAGGLGSGAAGVRYIALLICTRKCSKHWLPWRLGSFLTLCYMAGLVRIAGNGYQFRHRELQDYLARHPVL